jgi:anti-sigma regulatory factor (Ser/Thr protein kinase)
VMNILDIQRLKDNKITLNLQTVLLNQLLTEAIDYVHIAAVNKNIRVILSPNENYEVSCDEELISRVVINLLSNAIQYSPENSEVLIHTRLVNGEIEVSIRDHGVGMSENTLQRLKEQESVSDVQNRMSTGIGLQYCFLVLAAHRTNLNIVSAPGKGTTVSFSLIAKGINTTEFMAASEAVKIKRTLTETEKEAMKPFADRLRNCEVYEGSRILSLLNEEILDAPHWINDWKEDIRQAVFATNELAYNQLIEQLYE